MPALGISLILLAVGAILAFAVTSTVEGVSIEAIGVILMVIGAIGVLMSMLFMLSFSPFGRTTHDHRIEHRDPDLYP